MKRMNGAGVLAAVVAVCSLAGAAPARGAERNWLEQVNCRIAERFPDSFEVRADVELNTIAKDPAAHTFVADIHDGRKLAASVKWVKTAKADDRFWVDLVLDGKRLLRLVRQDMEIYFEQTIDGHVYLLHCFPPIELDQGDGDALAPGAGTVTVRTILSSPNRMESSGLRKNPR